MSFVVFASCQWCSIFIQQTYILFSKFRLTEVIIWLLSEVSLMASLWKTTSLYMSHKYMEFLYIHTNICPLSSKEEFSSPIPWTAPSGYGDSRQEELCWLLPAWNVPRPLSLESKVHLGKSCRLYILVLWSLLTICDSHCQKQAHRLLVQSSIAGNPSGH